MARMSRVRRLQLNILKKKCSPSPSSLFLTWLLHLRLARGFNCEVLRDLWFLFPRFRSVSKAHWVFAFKCVLDATTPVPAAFTLPFHLMPIASLLQASAVTPAFDIPLILVNRELDSRLGRLFPPFLIGI